MIGAIVEVALNGHKMPRVTAVRVEMNGAVLYRPASSPFFTETLKVLGLDKDWVALLAHFEAQSNPLRHGVTVEYKGTGRGMVGSPTGCGLRKKAQTNTGECSFRRWQRAPARGEGKPECWKKIRRNERQFKPH